MEKLTISQGLRQASRLKGKISDLKLRASAAVSYKASSKPAFSFAPTMERLGVAKRDLIALESRLAITNATVTVPYKGRSVSLSEAVKILQEMKESIAWMKTLPCQAQASFQTQESFHGEDYKVMVRVVDHVCDLTEEARSDAVDALQSDFDSLNDLVEKKNHETELAAL